MTDERDGDKLIADDGSPITVGGGGGKDKDKDKHDDKDLESNVKCKFKDADFPQAGSDHKKRKFRHGGWKIKTFRFRRNGTWEDHSDLLPNNGNCLITIRCEGSDDDVVINGTDFGIDMDPDTYQDVGDGVHRNPNADSFISRVVLLGGGQILGDWQFTQDDECEVCTDHNPNSDHCPS